MKPSERLIFTVRTLMGLDCATAITDAEKTHRRAYLCKLLPQGRFLRAREGNASLVKMPFRQKRLHARDRRTDVSNVVRLSAIASLRGWRAAGGAVGFICKPARLMDWSFELKARIEGEETIDAMMPWCPGHLRVLSL